MAEAGSFLLAEVMLWLMYIVFGVAVVAVGCCRVGYAFFLDG